MRQGFEFQAKLRIALGEAAERELHRGRLARSAAAARSPLRVAGRSLLPATAIAVSVVAALVVMAVVLTSGRHQPQKPPKVVARFTLADGLGSSVAAYGSVWIADTSGHKLLRVDPDTRRVTARVPVRADALAVPGDGGLLALTQRFTVNGGFVPALLQRIDPRTNQVTERTKLRTPAGEPFFGYDVAAGPEGIWLLGSNPKSHGSQLGALRIDPRTGRATRLVALPGGWGPDGLALGAGRLWAITANRRLLSFDARSGATQSNTVLALGRAGRPPAGDNPVPRSIGFVGDALVAIVPGGLAGFTPQSAHVLWHTPVGGSIETWTSAGGLIWAVARTQQSDSLLALDPRTGRVISRLKLTDFGTNGITAVGGDLWVSTAGGKVVIFRR